MAWQPIDTAPRDGTPILLYTPLEQIKKAQYFGGPDYYGDTRWVGWWFSSPKQIDDGWECMYGSPGDRWEPTHWMPLPEPPKITSET